MKFLDLTPRDPAANLALDEALLDACEAEDSEEILRFWEPQNYFVVVGYANKIDLEVNRAVCEANQVPIFRRCSGGGTVLQGQGCLNYSLILKITPELQGIPQTNTFIMERNREALQRTSGQSMNIRGHTDLALNDVKFSGNAQRRKKNYLIFHGTFLLNFDLPLIEKLLRFPSKQPDYRHDRPHQQFLTNLNLPAEAVKCGLKSIWNAHEPMEIVPDFQQLTVEKYQTDAWNLKF
ncbi:MAG: lplA [Verrucomicrobiales bacterium]|nr:lplA [Verrucomicrobiales bacterium]